MRQNSHIILNKRLPSLFGFLVLFLAIGTITWLSSNAILFGTQAATGNTPKDVKISNITDGSFTISYVTDANVIGTITFGTAGKMDQVLLDNRDVSQNTPSEYAIHYITVKNLTASTTYTFTITSGNENFLNGEKAYQVTTGPPITPSSSDSIVTGKVTNDDGSPAINTLVYLSISNSQILSTMTNDSGSYKINLNTIRTSNLSSLMNLDENTELALQIVDSTRQSSVSVLKGQTNPVPLIILSKNYDFSVSNDPLAPSSVASDSATSSFPIIENEPGTTTPKILTPQKEQEFSDQQPLFRGKAVPNETVTITINSEQTITATVTTDNSGNWQYRPNVPLEPGNHTITIRTIDAAGLMRVITQQFVVYAEGSQFTEPSVSPSASTTPIPTQQTTATPTKQPTNTPSPTKTSVTTIITQTQTKAATATPTKTASASISPTNPPVPVSGNSDVMILILGVVTAIGIGALLFVFATL